MQCEKVRGLLWDLHDGELGPSVYKEVIAHISACPDCAREAQVCQEVSRALAAQPALKAPEAASAAVMTTIRPIARRRRVLRGLWERRRVVGAAAAAAVIAVLGAFGVLPSAEEGAAAPTREPGVFARALESTTAAVKGIFETTGRSLADSIDYREATAAALPWLWVAVSIVAVLLAVVALEQWLHDRRIEAKYKSYLR